MQRAIGTFVGFLLARVIVPMLFGPTATVYIYLGLSAIVAVLLILHFWQKIESWRLRRRFCDEALLYARKTRTAFGDPDFRDDELREIRRARKLGDFQTVHAVIRSANMRLLEDKAKARRLASAQLQMQSKTDRRRPAEIRLYRA